MAEQDKESLKKDFEKILREAEEQETPGGEPAAGDTENTVSDGQEPDSMENGCENDAEENPEDADPEENGEFADNDGPMSWAEKKAAKKQAKQDKKADAYREKIEQLEDRVKRQMAEFENFRRRSEREKQSMFETGAKSVIEKILPVIDNFERGLATVPEENQEDPFVDGINRVYRQMLTELEAIDVKPIEAVGCEFDPNLHNAVMQVESDEYESGTVAQELQKGYTYRDSVVRHSMVGVVS